MNDEKSFLKNIQDNPKEAAVRFAFADWLEEHGRTDEAELYRVTGEILNLFPPVLIKPHRILFIINQIGEIDQTNDMMLISAPEKAELILAKSRFLDGILASVAVGDVVDVKAGDEQSGYITFLGKQVTSHKYDGRNHRHSFVIALGGQDLYDRREDLNRLRTEQERIRDRLKQQFKDGKWHKPSQFIPARV